MHSLRSRFRLGVQHHWLNCAAITRNGTALATTFPNSLCVPTDFIGQNAGTTYSFNKCLSPNVTAADPVRTECNGDDGCPTAQCYSNVIISAGLTTGNGSATNRFCTAATLFTSTYIATSRLARYSASFSVAACTPNGASSTPNAASSYI